MELRITFRSEIYIEGETMQDCINKWNETQLYFPDNGCSFIEVNTIEDANTFEDKTNEWDELY